MNEAGKSSLFVEIAKKQHQHLRRHRRNGLRGDDPAAATVAAGSRSSSGGDDLLRSLEMKIDTLQSTTDRISRKVSKEATAAVASSAPIY